MALFTATEFKTHEGIVTTAHDTLIGQLATRATKHFESLLHRKFPDTPASYVEDYSGHGGPELVLRRSPVTVLTSVSVDAERGFATNLDPSDYVLDKEAGILTRVALSSLPRILQVGSYWPRGDYNVRVRYTAGYDSTPEDLKEAAILWAARRFARRGKVGTLSETIGSHSVSFMNGGTDPDILEMIAPYRSVPHLGPVRDAAT